MTTIGQTETNGIHTTGVHGKRRRPSTLADLRAESAKALERAGEAQRAYHEALYARRDELKAELAEVEGLIGDVGEGVAPPAAKPVAARKPAKAAKPPKAKRAAKTRQRATSRKGEASASSDVDVAAAVLALLRDVGAAGATIGELESAGERGAVKRALVAGVEAGTIRAEGKARGKRYFVVAESNGESEGAAESERESDE